MKGALRWAVTIVATVVGLVLAVPLLLTGPLLPALVGAAWLLVMRALWGRWPW
jgi:hypothetical protein